MSQGPITTSLQAQTEVEGLTSRRLVDETLEPGNSSKSRTLLGAEQKQGTIFFRCASGCQARLFEAPDIDSRGKGRTTHEFNAPLADIYAWEEVSRSSCSRAGRSEIRARKGISMKSAMPSFTA